MSRRLRSLIAFAVAVVVLGGGFFPEAVFCVGDNGHRAFELTPQACCSPHADVAMGLASSPHGCAAAGCTDFKLAAERMLSKSSDSDLAAGMAAANSILALMQTVVPAIEQTSLRIWDVKVPSFTAPPRVRHTTVQVC